MKTSQAFSFDVLPDSSLVLTIGESCIRTASKQAHGELTSALLDESASDGGLEALVDLLAQFLNTTDFARLRSTYPGLAGGTRCRVKLYRDEERVVRWEVVNLE